MTSKNPAGKNNNAGAGKDGKVLDVKRERTVETPERLRSPSSPANNPLNPDPGFRPGKGS